MSNLEVRMRRIVSIVAGSLLLPALLAGCSTPTAPPEPVALEETASAAPLGSNIAVPAASPTEPASAPVPVASREAPVPAGPGVTPGPVGALSLIRMVASPDPKADGQQRFPEGSNMWVAFYAIGKQAGDADQYRLRIRDQSGSVVTEVPLYGPQHTLPEGSRSVYGNGGLVVYVAVPVFSASDAAPVGEYRSEALLNGSVAAELAWSVTP